jgi:arginine utilization protein RocB
MRVPTIERVTAGRSSATIVERLYYPVSFVLLAVLAAILMALE